MKSIVSLICFFIAFSFVGFSQPISWVNIEQVQKKIKAKPQKIIIDVYTDWCGWCKKMDKNTFSHSVIANYINKNFYAVKFNAEQLPPVTFKGKQYKFAQDRKHHQLANFLLGGEMGYPSLVFMDENLNIIQSIAGYQTPESLDKIIKYFGDDYYKKMPWKEFNSIYQSPF